VIVGSLRKLHKTSPLMLGTLHHLGVLDFVVTRCIALNFKVIDYKLLLDLLDFPPCLLGNIIAQISQPYRITGEQGC
jgi:hypothetical protein